MTIVVQDTFTDTNGTSLDAHTPDVVVSGGWTEQAGNWQITSNKAVISSSTIARATIESGEADCVIAVTVTSNTGTDDPSRDSAIIGRYSDLNNLWLVGVNSQGDIFRLVERNASTFTTRASASVTINTATAYALEATFNGANIDATLDGGNDISYGSATLNQTATIHGIAVRTVNDTVDDFSVDDGAAGGVSVPPLAMHYVRMRQ